MGYSGARPEVAETMLALLNAGITPVVREHGSLGASGDLAPLASAALVLLGEGAARLRRRLARRRRRRRWPRPASTPLELRAKEGLALINGTDGMLGMLVLALADLDVLLRVADIAGAMSTEALLGTDRAFAADLVGDAPAGRARRRARRTCARLLAGSAIVASHRHGDDRVQDAYSLRCTPQVHGAARDTVDHARADRRSRARVVHRQPGRAAGRTGRVVRQLPRRARSPRSADFLAISIADVGAISERRTDRLLDPSRSQGPAAVPGARRRRQLGPDDRPVHAGGDGRREPPPRRAGQHRHAADQRDAGGPRLARAGRRPASCASRSPTWPASWPSSCIAGSWGVHLRRPLTPGAGHRRGRRRRSSPRPADRDPTRGWRRGWPPSRRWSPTARSWPPCPSTWVERPNAEPLAAGPARGVAPEVVGDVAVTQMGRQAVTLSSANMPAVKCGGPSPRSGGADALGLHRLHHRRRVGADRDLQITA